MASPKVAVFGVPSAAGGRGAHTNEAPLRLREAGLLEALRQTRAPVVNLSDLSLFPYREDPDHPRARNASGVACAVSATADEMTRALAEGFTVVLGGDCTLACGMVAGARRFLGRPVGMVYLDADADLNTEETTPSGYLHGMALAMALGRGPAAVREALGGGPVLTGDHVALVGFRALDPGERPAIGELGLALPASAVRKLGMKATAALALDAVANEDGPVVVHLDVDVLDPAETAVKAPLTPGEGLPLADLSDLLTGLLASKRVVALEVCEYDPQHDPEAVGARAIVGLVARAVARRLRAG